MEMSSGLTRVLQNEFAFDLKELPVLDDRSPVFPSTLRREGAAPSAFFLTESDGHE
jgi:hypothetical protein